MGKASGVQHVFISFSRSDLHFAAQLKSELERVGFLTWIDTTSIPGGDQWIEKITEGINDSFALISIVSKNSNDSKWVRREYLYAEQQGKHILPVIIDDSDFPFYMLDKQAIKYDGDFAKCFFLIKRVLDKWYAPPPLPDISPLSRSTTHPIIEQTVQPARGGDRLDSRHRYLDRVMIKHAIWLEQYTPMAGISELLDKSDEFTFRTAETSIEQEFEAFLKHEFLHPSVPVKREYVDIVEAVSQLQPQRVAILGEPGGGKTTTLWRLVAEYCKDALADADAPVPIFVPLGNYEQDAELIDYIKYACENILSDLAEDLDALIQSNQVILLLDGLNEIPRSVQKDRISRIRAFLDDHREMSIIVSCREFDYIDLGLNRIHIKPLDPLRIKAFVLNYLVEKNAGENLFWQLAGEKARGYWNRFSSYNVTEEQFWLGKERPEQMSWHPGWYDWLQYRDNPRSMLSLARNPFMLYMISKVYAKQGVVPSNKGQLFQLFVNFLLQKELNKSLDTGQKIDLETIIKSLGEVAYRMQLLGVQGTWIDETTLLSYITSTNPSIDGRQILYIARSANLLSFGTELQFTHQLLQEYFAANRLDQMRKSGIPASQFWREQNWWEDHQWDETAIILAGLYNIDASPIISWIAHANPELAARCAISSGAAIPEGLLLQHSSVWIRAISDTNVPVFARAATARGLGLLNADNRTGVGITNRNIPDILWGLPVAVNNVRLRFSQYLITNKQFAMFVEADQNGYNNDKYWPLNALKWKAERRKPDFYDIYPFYLPNHPCTNVRWYESVAFCAWLSMKLGESIRLPTETEWYQAATGGQTTVYPYGDTFDATKANTRETGLGSTSAVGVFPEDSSYYGLVDISGNVREWCLNSYDRAQETADQVKLDVITQSDWRVVRGGAFDQDMWFARIANRNFRSPSDALRNIGFRIVKVE